VVQRLDRYGAGNTRAVATVRVPTEAEEQKRIQSRQREQLKREVQRIAAQGRGLLLSQGYRQKKSWWQEPRWELIKGHVPGWLVERLECFGGSWKACSANWTLPAGRWKRPRPLNCPRAWGSHV